MTPITGGVEAAGGRGRSKRRADAVAAITSVTLRALLARRRAVLMLLFAGIPVLIGLIARVRGVPGDVAERTADTLEPLIVRMLLPIVALVFGTAALGAEIEDGTAIHLLTKPVARWRIVLAKALAAAPLTGALVAASTLVTGLLIGGETGALEVTLAMAAAALVGALLYVIVFVALSVVTTRALIIGLVYVVIWEGAVAGLFSGTRALSIREYVMGIAGALDPSGTIPDSSLGTATIVVGVVLVLVVGFWIAARRLSVFRITAGD